MRSGRFGFREKEDKDTPRASVMPENMAPVDPLFYDAAFRNFEPETAEQEEALREKAGIR